MAKKIGKLIEETQTGLQELEQQLESARETRDEANRELRNARARLKTKERAAYPERLAQSYVDELKKGNILSTTLIKWIDLAVQDSPEFAEEVYLKPLYEVAQETSLYFLTIKGAGWNVEVRLDIIFEELAGNAGDWGQAVTDYREFELHTHGLESEKAGEHATDWWYENVYGTGLGDKTIQGRLNFTPAKAPYWQILEHGSMPLVSDRPGTHNPVPAGATLFIENAQIEIEDGFREKRLEEQKIWFDEEQELRDEVKELEEVRDRLSRDVRDLGTEFTLNQRIYRDFEEQGKKVDQKKLIKTIKDLRAGKEFENPKVNIGTKGNRVYLNISKVEDRIDLEYG